MIKPDLQPDVDLLSIILFAALNPAVIAVAVLMGRKADQPAKIMIAAFAAGIAAVAVLWLAAELRLEFAASLGRAAVGVLAAGAAAGAVYATIAYLFLRPRT